MTMVGSLLIAILALVFDFILGFIEKRISKRSVKAKKTNKIMGIVAIILVAIITIVSIVPSSKKEPRDVAKDFLSNKGLLKWGAKNE